MSKVFQYECGMSNGFFIFDKAVVAVDSGCLEGEEVFLDVCKKAGIKPTDIKLIIVTHGHVDHFYNVPAMKKLSGAPVMCHKNAADFLNKGLDPDVMGRTSEGKEIIRRQEAEGNPTDHTPVVKVDYEIEGDYDLTPWGVSGKLIYTPGHSRGCMSVVLDTREAIVGDIIVKTPLTGLPGLAFLSYGEDTNEELYASVRKLLDCADKFYSGHGGPFDRDTVSEILKKDEEAYREGRL